MAFIKIIIIDMEFYIEINMIVHVLLHLVNQLWKPRILIALYNEFNKLNNKGPHMSDYHMGLVPRKPVFCGLRTTKAETSLRFCAV